MNNIRYSNLFTATFFALCLLFSHQSTISQAGIKTEEATFQKITQIACPPAAKPPQFYSQPKEIWPRQVAWNPKHDLLAVWCTNTPNISVFDSSTFKLKYTLNDPIPMEDEAVTELIWSPQGNFLTKATQWDIDLWDVTKSPAQYIKRIKRLTQLSSISWRPDQRYFAEVEGVDINNERSVRIYDASTGNVLNTFKSSSEPIRRVLWSQDGKKLVAATWSDEIQIWDAKTYRLIKTVSLTNHFTIAWKSKDELVGQYCSSSARQCTLWILDLTTFQWRESFEATLPTDQYIPIRPSPEGNFLACYNGAGRVVVFSMATGKIYGQFTAHSGDVTSMSWNPDGTKLATGGTDGVVRIWAKSTARK